MCEVCILLKGFVENQIYIKVIRRIFFQKRIFDVDFNNEFVFGVVFSLDLIFYMMEWVEELGGLGGGSWEGGMDFCSFFFGF